MEGIPAIDQNGRGALRVSSQTEQTKTYNEKIQWMKIRDHNPIYPVIADKYRSRAYLIETLGKARAEPLFPELYMVTDNPKDLTAQSIPSECVIKANHGSGWNIFLYEDQDSDFDIIQRECAAWLRKSYGKLKHEWAYQKIPRKVVVEEMVKTKTGTLPYDHEISYDRR